MEGVTCVFPKRYKYTPQNDITAFELANIVPILLSANVFGGNAEYLIKEAGVERHFEEIKD